MMQNESHDPYVVKKWLHRFLVGGALLGLCLGIAWAITLRTNSPMLSEQTTTPRTVAATTAPPMATQPKAGETALLPEMNALNEKAIAFEKAYRSFSATDKDFPSKAAVAYIVPDYLKTLMDYGEKTQFKRDQLALVHTTYTVTTVKVISGEVIGDDMAEVSCSVTVRSTQDDADSTEMSPFTSRTLWVKLNNEWFVYEIQPM